MISGISKKVIFLSFLFINFIQPSKSAELLKISKNTNSRDIKLTLASSSNVGISPKSYRNIPSYDFYSDNVYENFLKKKGFFLRC